MILSALNKYYGRLSQDERSGISPSGYSLEKISYVLVICHDGDVVSVDDIREISGNRSVPKGLIVPQGEKRSSGVKPNFLWDKTSYVLGVSSDEFNLLRLEELDNKRDLSVEEGKEKRKLEKRRKDFEKGKNRLPILRSAFNDLHQELLKESADEGLCALLKFLDKWNASDFSRFSESNGLGKDFLDSNLVFRLDGDEMYLHQRPAAIDIQSRLVSDVGAASVGVCLVTGDSISLARIHPSIKGVKGSQSSGADIVSFNKESFTSYGKKQGNNAPISEKAVFAYTTALNHLLRGGEHNRQRLQVGDATMVFWAQADETKNAESAESLFSAFLDPKDEDAREAEELRNALEKVKQGLPLSGLNVDIRTDTRIFVLGLAPNASRLSIRFWETDTIENFARRLAQHYADLEIQPAPRYWPPSARWLVKVTGPYRKTSKGGEYDESAVSPVLAGEMLRAILTGGYYPRSLLSNLIMRLRADGEVSGTRVALIKGVLSRSRRLGGTSINKGEIPVSLDTSNTDPGYLLGRLFASLEGIQRGALGKGVSATIRDRFYGAASATPASIFPVLLRNAQNHLSKIRKEKAGLAVNMEKEIGEIINLLGTAFPKSLRMDAQGHFAIGYYHQSQARYARSSDQDDTDSE